MIPVVEKSAFCSSLVGRHPHPRKRQRDEGEAEQKRAEDSMRASDRGCVFKVVVIAG